MAKEMKLPELGENIETAEVVAILVGEGDKISQDQPVIELETDKATAEVPASMSGVVARVHVKKGDQVAVGQVIFTIDDAGSAAPAGKAGTRTTTPAPAAPAQSPPAGRKKRKAQRAGKAPVKAASRPGPAASPPPDPELSPERSPERSDDRSDEAAGPQTAPDAPRRSPAPAPRPAPESPGASGAPSAPASPSVRRLARELGVDVGLIPGTGSGGRISEEDLKSYVRSVMASGGASRSAAGSATGPLPGADLPDFSSFGTVTREPMTGIRRRTAEAMARAWSLVPAVTQQDRADITAADSFRRRHGGSVEKAGGRLTITAIAVKIAAAALEAFPTFNASVDTAAGEIVLKQYINVGVAVDTDRGLLVPVIKDANEKSLTEIAAELGELAARARARKTTSADLSGGSFTITNLGGLGTTYFSPIVNWPEVAILGLGRARQEPVYEENEFRPRMILPMSLTYDHRLIDGANAARFLRWMAEALENPLLLVLDH